MALADDVLADVLAGASADMDAWHRESIAQMLSSSEKLAEATPTEALREATLLRAAAEPVILVILSLQHRMPGNTLEQDATSAALVAIARRTVHSYQCAGLDARFTERNLRLLDRIYALIGDWPQPAWSEAVRRRVKDLADAGRRGRERGQTLRAAGGGPQPPPANISWMLRHPADHWFWRARPTVSDSTILAVIDDWIAHFAPSYAALAAEDWSAEEVAADLVIDVQIADSATGSWNDPIPTVGSTLRLRQVPPGDEPFNGVIFAALPRECWRICGDLLDDGTVLPRDGTRRLQPPIAAA